MSIEQMDWAWKQEIPAVEKLILLAICDGATQKKRIQEKTGVSGNSLESALCFLIDENFINESRLGCIEPRIGA